MGKRLNADPAEQLRLWLLIRGIDARKIDPADFTLLLSLQQQYMIGFPADAMRNYHIRSALERPYLKQGAKATSFAKMYPTENAMMGLPDAQLQSFVEDRAAHGH